MGRHSIPDPDEDDDDVYETDEYDVGYDEPEYETEEPQRGAEYYPPSGDYQDYRYRDDPAPRGYPAEPDRGVPAGHPADRYDDGYAADEGYRANAGYATDEGYDGYATDEGYDGYATDDGYEDDYGTEETRGFASALIGGTDEPPEPQSSGGHRNDGEWTGSHRTVAPGRRGVSVGVIVALVAVVAVVGGFIVWKFFGDALSNRSTVAAGRCLEGEATVAVLADPAIAEQIGTFAATFNEKAGPVGDHCVAVTVKPAESSTVVNGLLGEWPTDLGDKPALWIPGSSIAEARLQAAAGAESVSASKSLVSSPVLLAVRPELKSALKQQNWATLPKLQSEQAGLNELGLPGWGSLRLALPTSGDSDASVLAAEAVAVASAPNGGGATAGLGAVNTLFAGAPEVSGDSTDAAMTALLEGSDPAASPVHAVATTEQQLIRRSADISDAKSELASWLPPGPVALADFPAVLLAGDWLASEQVAAASEFERFLRKPEQLAELANLGFRVDGGDPPTSDVTDGQPLGDTVSAGDDAARVAVANAVSTPVAAGAPAVSIMLDKSLNLSPVVSSLNSRIEALAPNAAVGLTVFDGAAGTTLVNLGQLSDDVDGQSRRAVLTSTLDGLSPTGGAVSFTTLRNVYADALTNFLPGQTNSVLVITSGPHTDQSLGADGLQDLIRSSFDPARPVAVDVINVGSDPDQPTWESVAHLSGGSYQSVPASDSPEMIAAINAALA